MESPGVSKKNGPTRAVAVSVIAYGKPFFWSLQKLVCIIALSLIFLYVAFSKPSNVLSNVQRGLLVCAVLFIIIGIATSNVGHITYPHPAFWNGLTYLNVLYILVMVFALFQTKDEFKQLLRTLDPSMEDDVPQISYANNCAIYDLDNPEDPLHNIWTSMDAFVFFHFSAYVLKGMVFRDWWIVQATSVLWEMVEYSFSHQLPNFGECWWDHWVMDVLLCNSLGLYFGLKILDYLSLERLDCIELIFRNDARRSKRTLFCIGSYAIVTYNWGLCVQIIRWGLVTLFVTLEVLGEMTTFYLKFLFAIAPTHFYTVLRGAFLILVQCSCISNLFKFLNNPEGITLGIQCWVSLSTLIIDWLVIIKFGWETISLPMPMMYVFMWIIGFILYVMLSLWQIVSRSSFQSGKLFAIETYRLKQS